MLIVFILNLFSKYKIKYIFNINLNCVDLVDVNDSNFKQKNFVNHIPFQQNKI